MARSSVAVVSRRNAGSRPASRVQTTGGPRQDRAEEAALARLAASGDRCAWSIIYDRYADRLHDYCWSILRDRHEAEDVLHDAFVTAAGKIGQLRDPALLLPWLYAICRNHALGRVRRRRREVPSEEPPELAAPMADTSGPEVEELRKLVWDAAGGLAPRDRTVLELHLRHGMEGQELAAALGTNPHHATVLLGRVRRHVERSLSALLVGRTGRGRCAELDAMLAGWDGALSPLLRKRVARHIDGCSACSEQRSRVVSPLALLSGVPLLPAPSHLRDRVVDDAASTSVGAPGGSAGTGDGRLASIGRSLGDCRLALVMGASGLALLAVLGAVVVTAGRQGGPVNLATTAPAGDPTIVPSWPEAGSAVPTGPSAAASNDPTSPIEHTATPAPAVAEVLTRAIDFGATATSAQLRFRNTGGQPLKWTVSGDHPAVSVAPAGGTLAPGSAAAVSVRLDRAVLPEGQLSARLRLAHTDIPVTAIEDRPPLITDVNVTRPWLVPSSGCESARVSAVVADAAPVTVRLYWGRPGGLLTEVSMTGSGGRYSAMVGPVTAAGDVRWWIEATDQQGKTGRSAAATFEVRPAGSPCPA